MMGDGFVLKPENGKIYSPVSGTVNNFNPYGNMLSLLTMAWEVLWFLSLKYCQLEGQPFDSMF